MSKFQHSTRQTLADHSAAKVSVFTYYLGVYLNILGKVPSMQRVHVYDMMCGEGEYVDGRQGSALAGLRRVLQYFIDFPNETLKVNYVLNDAGESDVEKGRLKIDRVRERAEEIQFEPSAKGRIKVHYTAVPCDIVMNKAISKIQQIHAYKEKVLLFIDPWGYKDIRINDLKEALEGGHAEVLLFLPSEMMYRFARKAYHEKFEGGEVLQYWLLELFPEKLPNFSSVHDFINQFKHRLQVRIDANYSSRFTLETSQHNTYSLFYFTSNRKGLKAMLEAQWKQDQHTGSGHRTEQSFTLFAPAELTNYPARIESFLAFNQICTNEDLLEYGLKEGFLPKHTNEVLKALTAKGRLVVTAQDEQPIRKNAFYLDNPDRQIRFSLRT